jgi:hydroxymethylglutaryl-CoA lyase
MDKRHVEIVEVGPRDGLQNEPKLLDTATKVAFITRLLDAGVRRIEVASFVNPKRVPQMADAEQVVAALPRDRGASYIGLVLNDRGFDRAVAAAVDEVNYVVVASDTFNQRNQGATTEETLAIWDGLARRGRKAGIPCGVTIGAAFGCPFESEVPLQRVVEIARRVADAGAAEIALADTIGVAAPSEVAARVEALREAAPDVPLRCHFHNTRNTGLANAYAAVQAGVGVVDASTGGIGGCPFAPTATGNIPTEDLLYMLGRMGVATGISIEKVIETTHWLEAQLEKPAPAMVSKAGLFPKQRPAA